MQASIQSEGLAVSQFVEMVFSANGPEIEDAAEVVFLNTCILASCMPSRRNINVKLRQAQLAPACPEELFQFPWCMNAGVQAELILGAVERQEARLGRPSAGPDTYLEQRLSGDAERLMDEQGRAVMMAWEGPLMQAHAHAICQEVPAFLTLCTTEVCHALA